jgi:hypothetical protein
MSKKQNTIIKVARKQKDYSIQDNHVFRNTGLSWKAKGLQGYAMQLPEDWELNLADLENRATDGRDSVSSGVGELVRAGYWYKEQLREQGKMAGVRYWVFERPEYNTFLIEATTPKAEEEPAPTVNGFSVNGKTVNGETVNGKPVTTKVLTPTNTLKGSNNLAAVKIEPQIDIPADVDFLDHGRKYLKNKLGDKYGNLKGPEYWLKWELSEFHSYWEDFGYKHPKGKKKGEVISFMRSFSTWLSNWVTSNKVRQFCPTDPKHPNNDPHAQQYGVTPGGNDARGQVYDRPVNKALTKPASAQGNNLADKFKAH